MAALEKSDLQQQYDADVEALRRRYAAARSAIAEEMTKRHA